MSTGTPKEDSLKPESHESSLVQVQTVEDSYGLSPLQQGMLVHSLYAQQSGVDIEQMSCALHEALNVSAFKQAWQQVLERHSILRTGFRWEGLEEPVQEVHRGVRLQLAQEDWRGFSAREREEHLGAYLRADRRYGFRLSEAPLMRLALFRVAEADYHFIWTFHHALLDGRSFPLVLKEVFAFYEANRLAQNLELEHPRPYRDYIEWLQQQDVSKAEAFWRQALKGFRAPTPLAAAQTPGGVSDQEQGHGDQEIRLSATATSALQTLAEQHGLTVNTIVQGVWALLLSRYSGEEDVVFGATRACRRSALAGADSMVGLFINTLPIRARVTPERLLLPWLKELREQHIAVREYEHTPLVKVQGWSDVPRGTTLFESILVFENYRLNSILRSQGGSWEKREFWYVGQTNYPLRVAAFLETELLLNIQYARCRFDDAVIARMLLHVKNLLETIAANPDQPLSALCLMTEAERYQLLVEWNDTWTECSSDRSIHEMFEAQAERTPENIALASEEKRLSYAELNRRSNQLAHYLQKLGVGPEVMVGLCLERSVGFVIGLLGILKAGGAYVPLDPTLPKQRLAFMLEDTKAPLVVTEQRLLENLPQRGARPVCLGADRDIIGNQSTENPIRGVSAENAVYVIYTSGSTGRPKGVAVEHRQLVNYLNGILERLGLSAGSTFAMISTVAADLGNTAIFPSLCSGGCLQVVEQDLATDPEALTDYFRRHPIDCLKIVPSHLAALLSASHPWNLLPRRRLVLGGEACNWGLIKKIKQIAPDCIILNHYGPTEATIGAITYRVEDHVDLVSTTVPLGRPIANTQIYILDAQMQPVPIGVPGELYIGGDGLARGYLNRPELTAEKFVPNPFSDRSGARVYKTGDIARYLPEGDVEFLSRVDQQAKIRGYRIELGEVEGALAEHPAIKQTVVIAREDQPGEKRLVAYVVANQGQILDISELRSFLKQKLPDYMLPSSFVLLDELPLTTNGKLDRKALPAPGQPGGKPGKAFAGPRTMKEEILARIWADILNLDRVDIHDNFFLLGGHSLLATQVISRVRKTFEVELPFRVLFEAATVAEMAESIESFQRKDRSTPPFIPRAPRDQIPLSFAQQRLWFFDQLQPDTALFNVPTAMHLSGELNIEALRKTLSTLVERHEILRTNYDSREGQQAQIIEQNKTPQLKLVDLRFWPEAHGGEEMRHCLLEEALRPFSLSDDLMLRATLFQLGETENVLLLTTHHIASDGWSTGILFREMAALYKAFAAGRPSPLPHLPIQYADYAVWQRHRLDGEALEKELSYWRKQLEGAPSVLELPRDRPRPFVRSFRGSQHSMILSEPLTQSIKALSRREGVTLFMTLLAAFQTLLARYVGHEDIVVGTDVANRTQIETEGLIGFFVNLLVLRVDLSGNPSFRELLRRVREVSLGAYAHQEMPFEKLVEELQPERSLSHNPLVQVLFVLQNAPVQALNLPGLSVRRLDVDTGTSKFDLALFVTEAEGKLLGTWVYNTDLFEAKRVVNMASHYEILLANLLAQPNARLSSIEMLSETEKAQLNTEKSDRQVTRLRNLMGASRQAVDLSQTRGIRTAYLWPDKTLPLIFQPDMDDIDLVDWAISNRDFIDKELLKHGAILFRSFDLVSPTEFEKFAEAICPNLFGEYGDLPREGVGGKVYGSTPYPADQAILFHNESSHMHRWPMRIWFFCVQAAEQGGETPIVDCRRVYQLINAKLRDRFTEKKLMYVRNYTDGLDVSWQTFFRTTDRSLVEDYCRKASIDFEWNDNRLKTRQICPAVAKHPQTNEMVFFNQLQLHHVSCLEPAVRESLLSMVKEEDLPRNVYYGDGSPIEDSVIQEIRELYQQVAVNFPWQRGDILMLNNMLTAHGRNPYVGTRKILVAMGEMVSKDELDPSGPVL